uniref:Cytochrome c biogenesis protein transmembrane region n=1 Tax=Sporolithon durum TaxID=48970 RepID=A0A141SD05_9FLOR|nr:cytochrome c biogenesis protein transmembrane region [Sporolithon durum]AMK96173.1 cytochrome c biogenesis protein transmembrane region [Sporolithon durum]
MNLYFLDSEAYLYSYQQFFQNLFYIQSNNNFHITLLLLFLSGIFTGLNPCLISIFPISMAYVSSKRKKQIYNFIFGLYSSLFLGFILTFLLNHKYHYFLIKVPLIISIMTIFFGLNLLDIVIVNFHVFSIRLNDIFLQTIDLKDYLAGFLLGLNTSTCSAPVLLTFLIWQSYVHKVLNMVAYMIGYIIPLTTMLLVTWHYFQLSRLMQIWKIFRPAGGALILCFGILKFLDSFLL